MPQRVIAFQLQLAILVAGACLAATGVSWGQDVVMPGVGPAGMDNSAAPMSHYGEGSYFSQDLGTTLRLRYSTESYGQPDRGNFDIGTMQVLTLDGSAAFFDGQVTLNEYQGVGYNLGVGFRAMHFPALARDTGRIAGVSLWTDGTSTDEGNFFPQIGLSLESLGDLWDFRANGYLPLGPEEQVGEFMPTGVTGFTGFSISDLTQAVVHTSFAVAELEAARRLGSERDAWAFAGPYFVGNDVDDSAGYRVGLRGYAYPDLLVQVAVSDDEIFKTNAAFSVTWFVGRTRTDFQPACGVPDRFREPVMRNDYVALAQSFATSGIALTNPDGTALRIVHVDSDAPEGGDGSFENPFNMLTDINGGGSMAGDIVLAHALSVFNGEAPTMLKDNQRLLGEGNGVEHTVATNEGTVTIPETFPGARDAARPMVLAALDDVVVLANNVEFANFDIDGGESAAVGTNLTGNVNLHDLTVTNGGDFAILLTGNSTTSTVTLDDFIYDGGVGAAGGVQLDNFDGTFNATDSTFTNGTMAGLSVIGDTDGGITFANTVTFTSIDGTAVDIDGAVAGVDQLGGRVTINSAITNDTGRSVSVQNVATGANIDFNDNITDTGTGILVNSNSGGTITFATGMIDMDIDTAGATAILVTDNTGATVEFTGPVDIDNTGDARGLVATGGGTLRYSNTGNAITTETGQVVVIQNMTIAGQGVIVNDINRTVGAATAAVQLEDNTGGPIVLGDVTSAMAGDSGTLEGGSVDTVVINDSANVTLSGVIINNLAGFSGVHIDKTTAGTQTVNLSDLDINNGNRGVEVSGMAGAGALNMSINDTTIDTPTDIGLSIDNVDTGTSAFNNLDIDGNNVGAAGRGVVISDSNATFNFDAASEIREFRNTDFEVNNGTGTTSAGTISFAGDIINASAVNPGDTTGMSVHIHEVTGGTITFTATSSINDDNEGMLIEDNTGGTITFLGDNDFNTDANTAVEIDNNTGATISLSNLNIDTTSGQGFVATNGGTVTVLGTTNTIDTDTGVALRIEDMTIGAAGAAFQSINVTNGTTNGIVLDNLNGTGQVTVGNAGGADGSGGALTTTGGAIVLTDAANVSLNNIDVDSSGGNAITVTKSNASAMTATLNNVDVTTATVDGVNVSVSGSGTLNLNVNNSDFAATVGDEAIEVTANAAANDVNIFFDALTASDNILVNTANSAALDFRLTDSTVAGNTAMNINSNGALDLLVENSSLSSTSGITFDLDFGTNVQNGDVILRNNSTFSAGDATALQVTADGTNADINFLLDNNTFVNNSGASETVDILIEGGATLDANVVNNSFTNSGAAEEYFMEGDGASTRINLNLDNNTTTGVYHLFTDNNGGGFNFGVQDRDNTDANNVGTVNFDPMITDFEDIMGPVQMPTVP